MKRKDLLKTIISDSQNVLSPKVWPRTLRVPKDTGKIITLAGVRRSGKTYHLFEVMNQLIKQGVAASHILYLNFEDERLNLTTEELDLILQAFRELYPQNKLEDCYFFFDEIQEVKGWEKFVTRMYNTVSQHLFITGSNARLLSREIASELRGRTITFEVFPLSFSEFVQITAAKLNPHRSQDQAKLASLFAKFMHQGGFPELINQEERLHEKILQEYLNVMVLVDLIERYDISQTSILKYFCKRVISNSAGEFSVHKIYQELKSQGYQISKDKLYPFQDYVQDIYLTKLIPKFSPSVVKTEASKKKTYVIDQGLGRALDFKLSQDLGRILETTVAMELTKQGKQLTYSQNGSECDFIVLEKGEVITAIQVTADLHDDSTREREIKGLVLACQKFNLKTGIILTLDEEAELNREGIQVQVIPAWKYFYQSERVA